MKSLKNHISVISTLFIMLFSVQFSVDTYRIISRQNNKMINDYSIIIVSDKLLNKESFKKKLSIVKSLNLIDPDSVIKKLKGNLSKENIALLKNTLPFFYSIKLEKIQSSKRLKKIKSLLLSISGIRRVEIFMKSYENIYRILQILQTATYIFNLIMIFMSILLLSKQIRIWILEHADKIKIMGYFGANYWMKSSFLYRLVFIDSLIATFFVVGINLYIPLNKYINSFLDSINILPFNFITLQDTSVLFCISLLISMTIVTLVSKKMNRLEA